MKTEEIKFLPITKILVYDPYEKTAVTLKQTIEDILKNAGLEGITVNAVTEAYKAEALLKQEFYDLIIAGCYRDSCVLETSQGIKVIEKMSLASQVIIMSSELAFTQRHLKELGVPEGKINIIQAVEPRRIHSWEKPIMPQDPKRDYFNIMTIPPRYDVLTNALAATLQLNLSLTT